MAKVLVVFYSTYGHIASMAQAVAKGASGIVEPYFSLFF